ncbi:MAG: hypothetical protein MZV65_34755 [Chromatiales bacterium]|nr:hypothetical protein [Chromatiales bacterium]
MTPTHSIHDQVKPQPYPAMFRRAARPSAAGRRSSHGPAVHRSAPTERSRAEIIEPVLSIEEAIRRFTEEQPPQLYRGGA